MSATLTGFVVRRVGPELADAVVRPFGQTPLAAEPRIVYGAYGQPGDVLLGGVIVKPLEPGSACFQVLVLPHYRRNKIGTRLIENLFAEARLHQTPYLRLVGLVHQERQENAFYRTLGFSAERSFATYTVSLREDVIPLCERIAERFRRRHADLQIVTLDQLPAAQVAAFFAEHFGGIINHRGKLESGEYDTATSTAILGSDGAILAASLFCAKKGVSSNFLDLALVHPDHRHGPMPMVLFDEMARRAIPRGITHTVFEADAEHDLFATGFARRCNAEPQWYRFRYSIHL